MSTESVMQLIGEESGPLGLGENMGGQLTAGYVPERSVLDIPNVQIGDGLAGPVNEQHLQIFRDDRPIATDELGMQGPFHLEIGKFARHRAGRSFPLNYEWDTGLSHECLERAPTQDSRQLSPLEPGEFPDAHAGFMPVEVLPNPTTVYYTASPAVGWEGY